MFVRVWYLHYKRRIQREEKESDERCLKKGRLKGEEEKGEKKQERDEKKDNKREIKKKRKRKKGRNLHCSGERDSE